MQRHFAAFLIRAALGWAVFGGLAGPHPALAQSSNGVLREVYMNIGGATLADLTNHATFPDQPTLETVQPEFEAPAEFGNDYGQRMRALLVAPTTGDYSFWIASDDQGALYLSTTAEPAQKVRIAGVNGWTSSREWTKEPNQQSAAIPLQAGQSYYIEALQKEGGGGDNLAVRWQLPDGTLEEPIPTERLLVYGLGPPVISQQPSSVKVVEGNAATFAVRLERMLGTTFQWFRNDFPVPGATQASLTVFSAGLSDDGSRFHCQVANPYGSVISAEAILTVWPDTTRPTLSSVGNLGENQIVFVLFSEPVEEASALNEGHYSIDGGVMVTRAAWGVDNRTVILTTTPLMPEVVYTLTVDGVRDRASVPNAILPDSRGTFSLVIRPADVSLLTLSREPLGPSSRRHGVVISEVMYHPADRADGRNLEFIEIYNSQPWFEELGGWRISGAVDYVFPTGTILPSRGFLVIAASPGDLRAVLGLADVLGPFADNRDLPNDSGTLRLRNRQDAIVFEMQYRDEAPYPVAADGAGPSLILARPSYGERDPRAWTASDGAGGTPGRADLPSGHLWQTVRINEFLAHTDLPQLDFIELYNNGNTAVNLSGCLLSDEAASNKFTLPANAVLPARGFLVFTETELGFALNAAGERILLKSPNGARVIDAVRFGGQENGVSTGRFPDGAPAFTRLADPTPGSHNPAPRTAEVVINEIMFDPITADPDDEFVELWNCGGTAVDLSGWRLRDAVSFNLPEGTTIPAGEFLVIARNADHLRTNYPGLTLANTLGNYSGRLDNDGERIELNKPDEVVSTNTQGQVEVDTIHIVVDEVTYGRGGRWGRWTAGGGSSLELRDPRAQRCWAPNWAGSDESDKSGWVTVEATGVMDNGWADANQLHITLLGAGEALVDNVEVIPNGGANLLGNGTFVAGTEGWVFQGNHRQSGWEPEEGCEDNGSLHLRATGRGDTGSNRARTQLPYTLGPGTTATLRAKVRWLAGNPNILLRLRGNWLEAPGWTLAAADLGTPGAPNSRAVVNAGPAITAVRHHPTLPAAAEPVLVTAQVADPDGIAYLAVHYRLDPDTNYLAVTMTNNGAGLYSTVLPGQASGRMAAFYVQAADNHVSPAQSTFPEDAPAQECVVRWGDTATPGTLGTYRFWITQSNVDLWVADEKMSNHPKDLTFLYGTNRVIYNAGGFFHGSPYHSPGYNSPVGSGCDYDLLFPEDDRLLGETDINLFRPGNGGGDATGQREIHGYWFASQFGLPFLYHRPVVVYANGLRRDTLFHDAQQPNGDYVNQWFPEDADGPLHKVKLGFEFGDQAYGNGEPGYAVVGANLGNYTTSGGLKKLARYRQTWLRLSAPAPEQNDYTDLFSLVDVVNTAAPLGSDAYTAVLSAVTDVEAWFKVHVTQHLYNNRDSFSYGGGQNAFVYKPEQDTWKLFLWDIDFAFTGAADDPNLFGIGGADHGPRNTHPPFARFYWQALIEAAQGMLAPAHSDPVLDARYNGLTAAGAAVGNPQGIKDFIAQRRALILSEIAANQSLFGITSNNGQDFSTNRNLITLTGTAPLEVRTLLVNGVAYPVTWTSLDTWQMRVPLFSGTNTLQITGQDARGQPVAAAAGLVRVFYTGPDERPEEKLVFNEIMYHPPQTGGGFVELFNTSAGNAFDLSGWRVNGLSFTFPNGTILEPGAFLVLAEDAAVFAGAYGSTIPVAAEFSGRLDGGGETISLMQPGALPGEEILIDQVTYDDDPPWPALADGGGPSLQLKDPLQDNSRVANWAALSLTVSNPPQILITITNLWKYDQTSDLTGVGWTEPDYDDASWPWGLGLLYQEGSALPAPKNTELNLGRNAYYFRTRFALAGSPGGAALKLSTIIDDGAVFYLNGQEIYRLRMPGGPITYATLASPAVGDAVFEGPFLLPGDALRSGDNLLAVEVHQHSSGSSDIVFGLTLETTYELVDPATPGRPNSVRDILAPFPSLWLNEVLPNNLRVGTNGITDRFGDADPWLELYNGGTYSITLSNYFLASTFTNLQEWAFPGSAVIGPNEFLIVWLDGDPGQSSASEPHASFRAAPGIGSVVLVHDRDPSGPFVLDYLNYEVPVAGRSYGSYPDGRAGGRRVFATVTPEATNNPAYPPAEVRINEWMADNATTSPDPADGQYDDWFELYNPGVETVDLSGYYLSDTLANLTQWSIPAGTVIPAKGYLLVWADGSPDQNRPDLPDLHASFSLSKNGETIALTAPDAVLIDTVAFGPQATDVSMGRFPDGTAAIYALTNPTPRTANLIPTDNTPPLLSGIGNRTVEEGTLLTFTVEATDPDVPAQSLLFTLEPGAPPAAVIHPTTGAFSWRTTESDGPGVYPVTVRVTDNGSPNLSDLQSFLITVHEANTAPVLAPINSRVVKEHVLLVVTNAATDSDEGPSLLTFSLDPGAPDGMTIDPASGTIQWMPSEAQGPGNYTILVRVTDDGEPPLSSAQTFTVSVAEVNFAPELFLTAPQTVAVHELLSFTARATDPDLPAQSLTFSLDPGTPLGAQIDPATGLFQWVPSPDQVGTNQIIVRVTDDWIPQRTAAQAIAVLVWSSFCTSIHRDGAQISISFPAGVGQTYRVEYTDNLSLPNWTPLGEDLVADQTPLTVSDNIGTGPQRFYRVLELAP